MGRTPFQLSLKDEQMEDGRGIRLAPTGIPYIFVIGRTAMRS
jgi:hypothetical protein